MAKVDSITTKFRGQQIRCEIYFTKKGGFFVKDCPQDIITFGGFQNYSQTLNDLITWFHQAVFDAEEKLRQLRKVIVVKFIVTSDTIHGSEKAVVELLEKHKPDFFSGSMRGCGFSIDYKVLTEVQSGDEKLYYTYNENNSISRTMATKVYADEIVIPYSDQLVNTLDEIIASLKTMIIKIATLFSDKDSFQSALENGSIKMLSE